MNVIMMDKNYYTCVFLTHIEKRTTVSINWDSNATISIINIMYIHDTYVFHFLKHNIIMLYFMPITKKGGI